MYLPDNYIDKYFEQIQIKVLSFHYERSPPNQK